MTIAFDLLQRHFQTLVQDNTFVCESCPSCPVFDVSYDRPWEDRASRKEEQDGRIRRPDSDTYWMSLKINGERRRQDTGVRDRKVAREFSPPGKCNCAGAVARDRAPRYDTP